MCKFVSGALLSLLIGAVSTANAALISESFDSAASAAANGWVAVGNGVDGQVVGWVNDNLAGGVAGEGQFNVSRGAETRYADTTLGMVINGNTSGGFTMSGLLNVTAIGAGGDTGIPPILGFFSSPSDYLGIMFRNEGALNWGIRMETTGDGIVLGDGGEPDRNLGLNTSRTFSMTFDPTLGADGTITAAVSGAGAPLSYALSAFQRALLNSMSFNNFGLMKRGNGANPDEFVQLRIDNVSYTGVPEPTTLTLAMLLTTAAFGLRKPRQTQ